MKLKLTFALLLCCSLSTFSQTLDEILKKHLSAVGQEKLDKVSSLKMTGTMSQQGQTFTYTIINKRPFLTRVEALVQGMNMVQAYDGNSAWAIMPWLSPAPQALPEDQSKKMRDDADIDGNLVNYKEKGNILEFQGKEKVNENEAYKIKATKKDGAINTYFIDVKSLLIVKLNTLTVEKGKSVEVSAFYKDYKLVDGIMMAHTVEQNSAKGIFLIGIDKIDLNVPAEDAIFAMPKN